jgi:hypothetical protein
MTRRVLLFALVAAGFAAAPHISLPNRPDSVKFAVIGDSGTGEREQYETAKQLAGARARFPYSFVLMMGDNLYGGEGPRDFERKFEQPYEPLLKAGVKFYAALGNHDDANQTKYKKFNMNGERYYTFKPRDGVRFFALDSNYMDEKQLEWLEKELAKSHSDWKIAFFHHPLYSSGAKHGSDVELRKVLEPLFVKYGVSAVFTGHEHFYERIRPQHGITYFISGGAAKLRKGNIRPSELTAKGFDKDRQFMLAEIDGDQLWFEAISRTGEVFDSGVVRRVGSKPENISKSSPATSADRSAK